MLGPIRAYASEICRKEYQALGMSIITTSWGIGLVIGPALGRFLAQPVEKYPKIFSTGSIFGKFPYLLPCLLISIFALVVSVACFWIPETMHIHNGHKNEQENSENGENIKNSSRALLRNWSLM